MAFVNSYGDDTRAEAYAKLEFAGTYYLAYRDIPQLLREYVTGTRALDFGCGTGRSTRFLRQHGFDVVGIDISRDMVEKGRQLDPAGDYRVIAADDFSRLENGSYDVVLSAFTFDNIPGMNEKVRLFKALAALLKPEGKIINLVSSPEIYTHEWVSFSTKPFPANWQARPGDIVRTVIIGIGDDRPVEDVFWPHASYCAVYQQADLQIVHTCKPLATGNEPYDWVSETSVAPWVLYVLRKAR